MGDLFADMFNRDPDEVDIPPSTVTTKEGDAIILHHPFDAIGRYLTMRVSSATCREQLTVKLTAKECRLVAATLRAMADQIDEYRNRE